LVSLLLEDSSHGLLGCVTMI